MLGNAAYHKQEESTVRITGYNIDSMLLMHKSTGVEGDESLV